MTPDRYDIPFPFAYILTSDDRFVQFLRYLMWKDSSFVNLPHWRIEKMPVLWKSKDGV